MVVLSVPGSRSPPVPKNTNCWVPPTFSVAIELKIGWSLPAEYSFVVALIFGLLLASSPMSNRQRLPSRSPT